MHHYTIGVGVVLVVQEKRFAWSFVEILTGLFKPAPHQNFFLRQIQPHVSPYLELTYLSLPGLNL